jgi:hypothetical protein
MESKDFNDIIALHNWEGRASGTEGVFSLTVRVWLWTEGKTFVGHRPVASRAAARALDAAQGRCQPQPSQGPAPGRPAGPPPPVPRSLPRLSAAPLLPALA